MTVQGRYSWKHREHRSGRLAGTASFRAPSEPRSWAEPQPSVPEESWSPRGAETGLKAHRKKKLKPQKEKQLIPEIIIWVKTNA